MECAVGEREKVILIKNIFHSHGFLRKMSAKVFFLLGLNGSHRKGHSLTNLKDKNRFFLIDLNGCCLMWILSRRSTASYECISSYMNNLITMHSFIFRYYLRRVWTSAAFVEYNLSCRLTVTEQTMLLSCDP